MDRGRREEGKKGNRRTGGGGGGRRGTDGQGKRGGGGGGGQRDKGRSTTVDTHSTLCAPRYVAETKVAFLTFSAYAGIRL